MSRLKCLRGLVFALVVLAPVPALAQAISGTVTDSSGAVLPGVSVEASSPALIERSRTVTTDGAGRYNIVDLRPGVYTVRFSLEGFTTVARENVTLTGGFTAPVNVQMAVGGRQEVVTVTAASPLVDVTSVSKNQTITSEMLDSLPLGNRTIHDILLTIPGTGVTGFGVDTYRGSADTQTSVDGNRITWINGPGAGASLQTLSAAAYQEYTVSTGVDNLASPMAGMSVNVVPKEGGNQFRGSAFLLYSGEGWSSDNITTRLRTLGLTEPADETLTLDINPTFGGPIKRDTLWFQATFHAKRNDGHVLGLFTDSNADPFVYTPNLSDPFVTRQVAVGGGTRITWQATQKDKVAGYYDDEYNHWGNFFASAGASPEASTNNFVPHSRNIGAKWSRTHTSRMLFEVSYANYFLDQGNDLRDPMKAWQARDGSAEPGYARPPIPAFSDMEIISGIGFGTSFGIGKQPAGGFTGSGSSYSPSRTWTLNGSMTYITGSHNLKAGMTFLHGKAVSANRDIADVVLIVNNGQPAQITASLPRTVTNYIDGDWGFYAQDTWSLRRLTLKGGLRFDWLKTSYPDQVLASSVWLPAEQSCANNPQFCGADVLNWRDLSPRVGATYDLFGTGKTAIKAGVARYVAGETTPLTNGVNPASGIVRSTGANWTDIDGNHTIYDANGNIQRNEINVGLPYAGGFQNQSFGTPVVATRYDADVLRGFGKRGYTWEWDAGIDHQIFSRLSASLTYYHRTEGNQRTTDNLNLSAADYSGPFCLVAPTDPRLGQASGSQVCGLFDITAAGNLNQFLPASNYVTFAKNLGDKKGYEDINQGFDISLTSRLPRGAFISGGVDIRKTLTDRCSFPVAAGFFGSTETPETRFCRNETAFNPGVRLNGSYVLPYGVQAAVAYSMSRGPQFAATWTATNADIAAARAAGVPTLNRNLTSFQGTKSVTLIEPSTEYLDYVHNFDVRFSKIFNISRYRLTAGVDLYNAFNSSAVGGIRTGFGTTAAPDPRWLNPTGIAGPRQFRVNGSFDF